MTGGKLSSTRVTLLGLFLVALGAIGFHEIPGMIAEEAEGSKLVNSFYCSVITLTTVGYGDICPGEISGLGRTFIVFLSFSGLGMFCGPLMDIASSWKDRVPIGGTVALLASTIVTAVFVFSYILEEMSQSEAVYFSIITGTTIGYGDISPKSDIGKIAVALYAILAINVVASLLEPAKEFLLGFCLEPETPKVKAKEVSDSTIADDDDKVTSQTKQKKSKQKKN